MSLSIDPAVSLSTPQNATGARVGAEHEAAKLFEEIKTLNQRIAAFTANDEKLDVTKQLFDRIVTVNVPRYSLPV